MPDRKRFGLAFAILIVSYAAQAPTTEAFSSNQSPAIRIGEWKSSSYGILNSQGGLAFDKSGTLWVADSYNNRILGFVPPFSDNMSASHVVGQLNFSGTARSVAANRLDFPMGIAFDPNGTLWVADAENNRVLAFQPPFHNGMDASIVIGPHDFSASSARIARERLSGPYWVAFDPSGDLWIADSGNSRVLEFQPPFSSDMNASLVIGEPDFTHNYCDPLVIVGNCGSAATLNLPSWVAFDPLGDLWVSEGVGPTGRLLQFQPPFRNGMEAALLIEPTYAFGITFDAAGNLWFGCWSCGSVLEYKPPFNGHSMIWQNGVAKNSNLTVGEYDGTVDWSNVIVPTGIAFDSAGNLWVVDFRAHWLINLIGRVLGYDAQVHSVSTADGPVSFANQGGLLFPLSAVPAQEADLSTFPEGFFNFTVQGLPAGGSVTITITFPHDLPSGVGWWTRRGGNWVRLLADRTDVNGNRMTITLTGASSHGVISEFGGPAVRPINATTPVLTRTSQPASTSVAIMTTAVTAGLIIAASAMALYRRRSRKFAHEQN